MKPAQAYRQLLEILSKAGIDDAGLEAGIILEHVAGGNRFSLDAITAGQYAQMVQMAQKRATRYPLQYILGVWPFMDMPLQVGPGVLVPRPETETVCLCAAQRVKDIANPVFLDLCAGSGAIALGLCQLLPTATGTAVELYGEAFGWLQKNVGLAPKRVTALQANVLQYAGQVPPKSLYLIVSNPPYVTPQEYANLEAELYHEPKQALVAEEDGLLFYKAIARQYKQALKPGGWLVFEIGAGQGEAVQAILEQNGYNQVAVQQDLAGLDRVALGCV